MRKGRLLENFVQGHIAGVEPGLFPTSCLLSFSLPNPEFITVTKRGQKNIQETFLWALLS